MDSHKGFSKYAAFQKMAKHGYDDKEKKDEKKNKSDKETDDTEKIVEFDPEFLYVRVRAVSANVPNNNGDLFEEDELRRTYKSFINKSVFKNHKSDDVTNAVGRIVDAVWVDNAEDHDHPYVECLLEIDRKKDHDLVRGIEKGYTRSVSMGSRVEYSVCSCCKNKAYKEEDYCECVKHYKGQNFCPDHKRKCEPNGIYESNFGVEFFEISFVTDGADREALVKEIVASNDATVTHLVSKMASVGQILVDTDSPFLQESGGLLKKYASMDVISSKELKIIGNLLDLVDDLTDEE
jgi:hypothetical protein